MESKGPSGPRRPLGIKLKGVVVKKTEDVPTSTGATDITHVTSVEEPSSSSSTYNPSVFGKTRPTASLGTPTTVATPSAISSATSARILKPKPKVQQSLAPIPELPSAVSASVPVDGEVAPVPAEVPPVVPGVVSAQDPELLRMQSAIEGAISDVKYKISNETAQSFMSSSFQGFSKYIQNTFLGFTLPMRTEADKTKGDACDVKGSGDMTMNLYQSFVREYMRQATPYRGLLVYHGLGSGKTCTSIAAAEALYGSHQKKIIVLTPVALKRNFIGELSFCGFKHFKLQNYWVKYDLNDESYKLFAIHNAKIPKEHIDIVLKNRSRERRVFFMPDFNKSTTPNYDSLPEWEKTAIKNQINATIEGNITFIGYTGISVENLKKLLITRAFDNSVVVIDEVHNLTRLMSNNVEKFLKTEPMKTQPWTPSEGVKYNRAILLYALISGAQNSKIIALSGTPIVNFNDEIGILGNLVHGYFHGVTMVVPSVNDIYIKKIAEILAKHPRVEYYKATPQTNVTEIFFTKVRDNYVKTEKGGKQIYMHYEESHPLKTIEQIYADIKAQISKLDGSRMEKIREKFEAIPLFPVERQKFETMFIEKANSTMKNKEVFCERMTGLISYYRGAREEFMPRVESDEIVYIDMSDFAMIPYSEAREMEREQQKSKPKPATGFDEGAQAMEGAMSYRFRSRSLCNFAFPTSIKRPFPQKEDDFKNDLATDELVADSKEGEPLVEENSSDESSNSNSEDENSNSNSEDESSMEGGDGSNSEEESNSNSENSSSNNESSSLSNQSSSSSEEEESSSNESSSTSEEESEAEESNSEQSSSSNESSSSNSNSNSSSNDDEDDCERFPKHKDRVLCTLNKLKKYKDAFLKLDKITQYSPKYKAMFEKIAAIDGSSLVYSQFRTLEGLGIFAIMLEANGFAPLEILGTKRENMQFSETTKKSLLENPMQPRYIIYSGSESDDIRNTLKDIFNMDVAKLPTKIKEILLAPNPNISAVAKDSHSYIRATRLLGDDSEAIPTNSYYATKNLKGELCKVFMITGAGAEGLSLRSVRAVHIMEPYWNNVRIQQVKGRAIRICSHSDLPEDQRFVNIYTYIMKFKDAMKDVTRGEGTQFYKLLTSDDNKTTDEHILQLSNEKEKLNNEFLHELKRAAVDCPLNLAENYTEEEPIGCYVLNVSDTQTSQFLFDPRIENHTTSGAQGIARPVAVPMGIREASAMEDAVVPPPVAVAPPPLVMRKEATYTVAGKTYNIKEEPNEKGVTTQYLYNRNTKKKVAYMKTRENGKKVPVIIKTRNNKNTKK